MAFIQHLRWGPSIDWTHGPLGFLVVPVLYYRSTALLAILFLIVEYTLLLSLVFHFLRGRLPLVLAVVLTYLLGVTAIDLVTPEGLLPLVCFFVAIFTVRVAPSDKEWISCACVGVIGAIGGLVLLTVNLLAAAFIIVIAATSKRWWKCLIAGFVAYGSIVLTLWPFSGGSVLNIPSYGRYSLSIIRGYGNAMSVGASSTVVKLAFVISLVVIIAAIFFRSRSGRDRSWYRDAALAAIVVVLLFQEGFIRDDTSHEVEFFALACLVPVPFIAAAKFRAQIVASLIVLLVVPWCFSGSVALGRFSPVSNVQALGAQLGEVIQPGEARSIMSMAHARLRTQYGISSLMISAIRGKTLAIEPWQNSVAWAYDSAKWDPEPVLQAYSAYTTNLDELDARFLASRLAPQRILVAAGPDIDGRDPSWDPPSTELVMLCRYRQISTSSRWELLGRIANRCGSRGPIKTTIFKAGAVVQVPKAGPDDLVAASFRGVGSSLSFRFEQTIFKPPEVILYVKTDGRWWPVRFLTGTEGGVHVFAVPSTLRYSTTAAASYANPTNVTPPITAIRFWSTDSSGSTCAVSFFSIPMRS